MHTFAHLVSDTHNPVESHCCGALDMPTKNENDGFTPEQHLVAAVAEYKNLETANRSYMERMIGSLSSPFKISSKPCEQQRLNVLQCYDRVLKTSKSADETDANDASEALGASSASAYASGKDLGDLPIHHCYPDAVTYQKCVKENVLGQHLALSARFEERRLEALSQNQ